MSAAILLCSAGKAVPVAPPLNWNCEDWFTSDFEGDLRMNGKATLAIMPLRWNGDGWPETTVNDVKSAPPAESAPK